MYKLGKNEDNKTMEIKMLISTREKEEDESNGDSSIGRKGEKTRLRNDQRMTQKALKTLSVSVI